MIRSWFLGTISVLILTGQTLSAQAADTAGALAPGWFAVGFGAAVLEDSTRHLANGEQRPIPIAVWYPAIASAGRPMSYREYFEAFDSPLTARKDSAELQGFIEFIVSHGAPGIEVLQWLNAPMHTTMDAPVAAGRFPLVLIAQGNGETVRDQAPLAEYLASHGYVVATTPSPMRITGPLTDEAEVGTRAAEQARDLAYLRKIMSLGTNVAGPAIGVVSHSFGARGAMLFAMGDSEVTALVSLDGGIGTATARASTEAATGFKPEGLRAHLLHFYETLDAFMAPDFGLLRSLDSADRWLVPVSDMHHHHFSSFGAVALERPELRSALAATDATGIQYAKVARATLEFLDAYVKHDAEARDRIEKGDDWPAPGTAEHLKPGDH